MGVAGLFVSKLLMRNPSLGVLPISFLVPLRCLTINPVPTWPSK